MFEMVNKPMGTNVCFSYIPPKFRGANLHAYSPSTRNQVHAKIYEEMKNRGTLLVQYNPLEDQNLPNFFRMVHKNDRTTFEDMDYILREIDKIGSNLII